MPRFLAAFALLVATVALSASPALARDHDKLPDRWERKHHLNLAKNDAKRDRDRDGLSNLREYRAHTNPRKKDSDRDRLKDGAELRLDFNPRDRDSDDDGIKDGRENAGKITKLSGSAVTIRLAAGGKLLNARVADDLTVSCPPAGDAPDDSDPGADTGDDSPGEDAGDDPAEDEETGDTPDAGDDLLAAASQDDDPIDDPADLDEALDEDAFDRQFDEEFSEGAEDCAGTSRLKQGALVHEAKVERRGGDRVLVAVQLVRR